MKITLICLLLVSFSGHAFADTLCNDLPFVAKTVHEAAYSCFIQNPGQLNETLGNLAVIQYPNLNSHSKAISAVINDCVNPELSANGLKPIGFLLDILVGLSMSHIDRFDSMAFIAELNRLNCR
jgi:hypothetical protein